MLWLLAAAATGYALAPDNETVVIQQPATQPVQTQEQTVVVKTVCVTPDGETVLCPTPTVEVKDANTTSTSK